MVQIAGDRGIVSAQRPQVWGVHADRHAALVGVGPRRHDRPHLVHVASGALQTERRLSRPRRARREQVHAGCSMLSQRDGLPSTCHRAADAGAERREGEGNRNVGPAGRVVSALVEVLPGSRPVGGNPLAGEAAALPIEVPARSVLIGGDGRHVAEGGEVDRRDPRRAHEDRGDREVAVDADDRLFRSIAPTAYPPCQPVVARGRRRLDIGFHLDRPADI